MHAYVDCILRIFFISTISQSQVNLKDDSTL